MLEKLQFWRSKGEPATSLEYARLDLPEGWIPESSRHGDSNPLVFAVVDWIATNIRKVEPVLEPAHHPALALLSADFRERLLALLLLEGVAPVRVLRNSLGMPSDLQPINPQLLRKSKNNRDFEAYLRVHSSPITGESRWTPIKAADLFFVQLRDGKSPLRALIQDLVTDDEATLVTNYLLRNRGLLGLVVSPAPGQPPWATGVSEQVRRDLDSRTTGSKRGSTVAISAPVSVASHSVTGFYDALNTIRDIPESHVAAAFHVPAAVVGFGTGIEQTTVGATLTELRAIAWDDGILPHADRIYSALEKWIRSPQGFNTPNISLRYSVHGVSVYAERRRKDLLAYSGSVLAGIYSVDEIRNFLEGI